MKMYITPKILGLLVLSINLITSDANAFNFSKEEPNAVEEDIVEEDIDDNENYEADSAHQRKRDKVKGFFKGLFGISRGSLKERAKRSFNKTLGKIFGIELSESQIGYATYPEYKGDLAKFNEYKALELEFFPGNQASQMPKNLAVLHACDKQNFMRGAFSNCTFNGKLVIFLDRSFRLQKADGSFATVLDSTKFIDDIDNDRFTGRNYQKINNKSELQYLLKANFGAKNKLFFMKGQEAKAATYIAVMEEAIQEEMEELFNPRANAVKYEDYKKDKEKYENEPEIAIDMGNKRMFDAGWLPPKTTTVLILGNNFTLKDGDLDECENLESIYFEGSFSLQYTQETTTTMRPTKKRAKATTKTTKLTKTVKVNDINILLSDLQNGKLTTSNYSNTNEEEVIAALERVLKKQGPDILNVLPKIIRANDAAAQIKEIERLSSRITEIAKQIKPKGVEMEDKKSTASSSSSAKNTRNRRTR